MDLTGRTPLGWLPQTGGKEESVDLDHRRAALIAEVSYSVYSFMLYLQIPLSIFLRHILLYFHHNNKVLSSACFLALLAVW